MAMYSLSFIRYYIKFLKMPYTESKVYQSACPEDKKLWDKEYKKQLKEKAEVNIENLFDDKKKEIASRLFDIVVKYRDELIRVETNPFYRPSEDYFNDWGVIREMGGFKYNEIVRSSVNSKEEVISLMSKIDETWERFDFSQEAIGLINDKSTPAEFIENLIECDEESVRCTLTKDKRLSKEGLERLLNDKSLLVQISTIYSPRITKELLSKASRYEDYRIREAVGFNFKTPKEDLLRLAKDESSLVRIAVSRNYKAPRDILELLLNDEVPLIRANSKASIKKQEWKKKP